MLVMKCDNCAGDNGRENEPYCYGCSDSFHEQYS